MFIVYYMYYAALCSCFCVFILKKSIRIPLQHIWQSPPADRITEFKLQNFSFTPAQVVELIPTAIPLHCNSFAYN
jgi:hypothetical protein